MDKQNTPRYIHDCKECIYLGQKDEYDLYFCNQGGLLNTVIARFGNEGPDYISGMSFSDKEPLKTAKELAKKQNLL